MNQSCGLIAAADEAVARGDRQAAANLLEQAAQHGQDVATLVRLATVRRSLGDPAGALTAASAAAALAPRDFLVLLLLGSLHDAVGAIHSGEKAYRAALRFAPPDRELPPILRQQLDLARRRSAALEAWRARLSTWRPRGDLELMPANEQERIDDFRLSVLESCESAPLDPPQFIIPGVPYREFFDPADFRGVGEIEEGTQLVLDEFLRLAEIKGSDHSSRLNGLFAPRHDADFVGRWSMIPLVRNGEVVEAYAKHCPATMRLFGAIDSPELSLISPSLYFSVLEPHCRIEPHTGLTNARLIVHWPLIAPDGCAIRVGSGTRQWVPGRALVFDDMIEHEAWNDSDRIRVVLIADLWRPELSLRERAAIRQLMARNIDA